MSTSTGVTNMYDSLLFITLFILIILAIALYQKITNAVCLSTRRLEGKTVIVTGGTAGMGLEIATDLAHRGAKVIVACPFEDEGTNARKKIIEETGNPNVVFKLLNLASTESVRKFSLDILKDEDRLDILINNAGVGTPKDHKTSDGMNFAMQVNYYGTCLLTLLLLPLLKKTGQKGEPARILVTSSVLHLHGFLDIENLNRTNYWYKVQIYSNSKICLVMFARELSKRIIGSNVVVNIVDPGAVATRIFESVNRVFGICVKALISFFFKSPWQGAQTALHVALDKNAGDVSGQYFKNCEITNFTRSSDNETMKRLWNHTAKLVGLGDDELDKCFKSL